MDHFFAVTQTSIYEIVAKAGDGYPSVQKIACDKESLVAVGQELEKAAMVGIGKFIVSYIPEGGGITSFERRLEWVNTRYWVGTTSSVVGLFSTAEEARKCFKAKKRKPADKRWLSSTKKILEEIGTMHPVFYICTDPKLRLLP